MTIIICPPAGIVAGAALGGELAAAGVGTAAAAGALGGAAAATAAGTAAAGVGVVAAAGAGASTAVALGAGTGVAAATGALTAAPAVAATVVGFAFPPAGVLLGIAALTTATIATIGASVMQDEIERSGVVATFDCWRQLVDIDTLPDEDIKAFSATGLPLTRLSEFCDVEAGDGEEPVVARNRAGESFHFSAVYTSPELILLHAERVTSLQ
ncbi:hypothetical protein CF327_g2536 [Tilletia walkeri]|nr:hypothetical protein CF327_g2536 [Tilletia walkeri]